MPTITAHTDFDSSPPPVVETRRSLKRTASTASLPTPPRTVKKSTRTRSRGSVFDSDDSDASDYEGRAGASTALFVGNKKRRTGLDAVAAALAGSRSGQDPSETAEDAFWMGDGRGATERGARGTILQSPPDILPEPKQNQAPVRVRAPLSPPPSRRRTTTQKRGLTLVAPVTPPRRSTRKGKARAPPGPVRDSPNNPFLVSDEPSASIEANLEQPKTPTPHAERPTLTYVYRGVKTVFANPLYLLDPEEHARSLLPADHEDFEPTELCPPKLLFPEARRKQPSRRAKEASQVPVTPPRLPCTPPPRHHVKGDTEDRIRTTLPKKLVFTLDVDAELPEAAVGSKSNVSRKTAAPTRVLRRSPRRAA